MDTKICECCLKNLEIIEFCKSKEICKKCSRKKIINSLLNPISTIVSIYETDYHEWKVLVVSNGKKYAIEASDF